MKLKKGIITFLTLGSIFLVGCSSTSTSTNETSADTITKIEEQKSTDEETSKEESTESETIKESEVHFIDTGNSDSILIKNSGKFALIDGGDNDDEDKVVNYLKEQGVSELEYVFATHPHADHIGGLDAVIDEIKVNNILVSNGDADTKTYSDFINSIANKGLTPTVPLLNSKFNLGNSTFEVLSVANESEPNNNSLVLLYTNGEDKILLMGDAESEIENQISIGDVDLIKVGHHGSSSSSNSSFIDKVNPEYAVITVGADNTYGHPHRETMETLKNKSIEVHRTDECGNVVFKSSGDGLVTDCEVGSYNPGNNATTNNKIENNQSNNENNYVEDTTNQSSGQIENTTNYETEVYEEPQVEETVYWTPKGKSYHTTSGCPTLSRSKTILSGTISESGKYDPCDRCH